MNGDSFARPIGNCGPLALSEPQKAATPEQEAPQLDVLEQYATQAWIEEQHYCTPADVNAATRTSGSALIKSISKWIREKIAPPITARFEALEAKTASMGDAARIAELIDRLAALERRVVETEKGCSSHRRHLNNLEMKLGTLIGKRLAEKTNE
jgi:hypothetical protein